MEKDIAKSNPADGARAGDERDLKRSDKMSAKGSTAAQLRGDIDRGRTGDKAAGVDPAAAPMETDAEAGGTPPSAAEIEQARVNERRENSSGANASAPSKTPDGGR
jgi:hypothetical protein